MPLPEEAQNEIEAVAHELDVEPAAMAAIVEVESAGRIFATVDGRNEPLIRFEGHYFDRRLSPENQTLARAAGLASPDAGAVANPDTQASRWRLLDSAAEIDRKAAYESTSWGVGQVMGAHWAWLGYADVDALVAEARAGAAGQLRLMARYIDKAGLVAAIRDRDWAAFAHGYNGPNYARNSYDRRIAEAYARHSGQAFRPEPRTTSPLRPGLLRRGSRGEAVAELQRALIGLGHELDDDGIFGGGTERAVRAFQTDRGLDADGIVGKQTRRALDRAAANGLSPWHALLQWLARLFKRG